MSQDRLFVEREGDAWFRRNRGHLNADKARVDWPLKLITLIDDVSRIRSVIEVGCSNGYRLSHLRELLPRDSQLLGIDVSQEAINDGHSRFEGIKFARGTLSRLPVRGQFDLVIVNFVLHWIDRSLLAQSIAEIDRVTRDGGLLMLGDFLPDFPQRRRYHYCRTEDIYTYKQNYPLIFEALGTYRTLAYLTFDHDHSQHAIKVCDSNSRGSCTLLHKSLTGYYKKVVV